MSTLLNKDRITLSIANQLSIKNQVVISTLSGIIDNTQIVDYDSIKLLSKAIKEHLTRNNIETQHSKVLNIIAKALGYQNHHSLKNNFSPEQTTAIDIDFQNDSTLKKFYAIKDEFLSKFEIEKLQLVHGVHKGHEFDFLYHKQGIGLIRKDKIEVNKFLRAHNIKPYKNTISLFKIKYDNINKVAFNILQHYRSFFRPIWHEKDNTLSNYDNMINFWYPMSYSDIRKTDGLLIVDSYSTDLPWNIITNFIDYVFNFGTIEDIEFFEKCLKQNSYTEHPRRTKTMGELSRIGKWEEQEVLKSIVSDKKDSLRFTLENTQCKIGIQKYMLPYCKELEVKSKKSIKELIIDSCEHFYNLNKKYSLEDIENYFFKNLTGSSKDKYIEHMEEFDDLEIYRPYHDRYNTIHTLADNARAFINRYRNVELNYVILRKEYISKGYIH